MAFLEWRRLNFFDLIKDVDGGKIAETLKDAKVSVATSGHAHLVLGDTEGIIHIVNHSFQVTIFRAYEFNVSLAEQSRHIALLVTIGEDEPGVNPVIKVWHLDKLDKHGHPQCIRKLRAVPGHKPIGATALCVHENLNYMAVGFADGSIMLYRGEMTRGRTSKFKVLKDTNFAVTGLALRTISECTYLFVATENNVYLYNITVKDKEQKIHLDDMGCARKCSVLAESVQENHFMIARNDAVYCYTPDGRGPCYAVEGLKVMLHWFRSYLVIVAKVTKSVTRVTSGTSASTNDGDLEKFMVTILDIQNKFIVFSASLQEVHAILTEWGSFYILGGDKKLYHLQEKDLQFKLALLFKKNLYDVGIRIAKSQHYDSEGLIDIFRQYGDYLYTKGDHSAAIEQYINTIGKLEPSYIIQKFMGSQHIDKLTIYLQALHIQGHATENHTTLLLNCYTILNNAEKLEEFIMAKDRKVDFDIEIAIKVCRQVSLEDALLLAKKHGMHDWYLKLEIEDRGNYREALEYISSLEFEEVEENMKKFGNILIEKVPDEATLLLKNLCTDYRSNNKSVVGQSMLDGSCAPKVARTNPEVFIHLFLNNSEKLVEFLEHLVKVQPKWSPLIYNTLIEHYLHIWASKNDPMYEQKVVELLQNSEANFDKDHIIILCHIHSFKSGIMYLYEESKLYQHIVQYYIKQQEYESALASCRRFGHQDPNLWEQAFWSYAKDPNMPSSFLAEILSEIEKERLLSPLLVVDAVSNSSNATLGDIRNYLLNILQSEKELIEKEQELIDKYRQESERARIQIKTIQTGTMLFQGSRCSACHHQLQLPSIYFLCQHFYHQHCFQRFAENCNECPACFPENKKILDMIKSQEQDRDLHEVFHSQLEKADDGFSLIAEYFRHSVFKKLTVFTDSASSISITKDSSLGKRAITSNQPAYGPSAEGRLRLMVDQSILGFSHLASEWRTTDPGNAEESFYVDSYGSSLEANLTRVKAESSNASQAPPSSAYASPASILQQPKAVQCSPVFSKVMSPRYKQQVTGSNPFEGDYDESRNPFADDDSTNPFAENNEEEEDIDYDKKLNPFAS